MLCAIATIPTARCGVALSLAEPVVDEVVDRAWNPISIAAAWLTSILSGYNDLGNSGAATYNFDCRICGNQSHVTEPYQEPAGTPSRVANWVLLAYISECHGRAVF